MTTINLKIVKQDSRTPDFNSRHPVLICPVTINDEQLLMHVSDGGVKITPLYFETHVKSMIEAHGWTYVLEDEE